MSTPGTLERLEKIIDTSAVAGPIEALLPVGVRPRQLKVRTLLLGMLLIAVQDHQGRERERGQDAGSDPWDQPLALPIELHARDPPRIPPEFPRSEARELHFDWARM
jgi:hypothetical protein